MSPFLLVYGRQAKLPVELTLKVAKNEAEGTDDNEGMNLEEYTSAMVAVRREALENIEAAQERQKAQYDAKHGQDKAKYKVGSLVLVKNSRKLSRKGSKMNPNWLGPYRIHQILNKGTFRLSQAEDDTKILTQVYNMTRLKLYYKRDTASESKVTDSSSIDDDAVRKQAEQSSQQDLDPQSTHANKNAVGHVPCHCRRSRCSARKSCTCKRNGQFCSVGCHPGHSCTNCKNDDDQPKTIDLSKVNTTSQENHAPRPWKRIQWISLTERDKEILVTPGEWLDDNLINAAQILLKMKFSAVGGLQSCTLAEKLAFEPQGEAEFVQILNIGRNHWITISTIGCESGSINVYDSMHWKLSSITKKVIADLLMTTNRAIKVTYRNVQWQKGGSDCGLFAIAFATSVCLGNDPAALLYSQPQMRNHFLSCIDTEEITDFPQRSSTRRARNNQADTELISVFCVCRLPDDGELMVQCSQCKEWYHKACIGTPDVCFDETEPWFCNQCNDL